MIHGYHGQSSDSQCGFQVREPVEVMPCEEHAKKVCKEAAWETECIMQREWWMEEKLEVFVESKLTEEEFERD